VVRFVKPAAKCIWTMDIYPVDVKWRVYSSTLHQFEYPSSVYKVWNWVIMIHTISIPEYTINNPWFIPIFINKIQWLFHIRFSGVSQRFETPRPPFFSFTPAAISDEKLKKGGLGVWPRFFWRKYVQFGAFLCNQKYEFIKLIFLRTFTDFQLLFHDLSQFSEPISNSMTF